MPSWIALLRGVNVAGRRKLPMADLRTTLTGLGLSDVATYIQSGNVVFRASGTPEQLAEKISAAIAEEFGFDTDVLVIPEQKMADALDANPFPEADDDPSKLYLYFPFGEIGDYDDEAMMALATQGEAFATVGNVFYFHAPNGVGRSVLGGKLPRFIAVPLSARNLRSCRKILELSRKGAS